MILYDLPKFSSELKCKAISILHEKDKLNSAQCGPHGATRARASARWPIGVAHMRLAYSARQPTAGNPAHAGILAKMHLDFELNNS